MFRQVRTVLFLVFVGVGLPDNSHSFQEPGCFPEIKTKWCVDDRFRNYWEENGGLPVFGYPITSARKEINRDTEEIYITQWFERNRFELHPEKPAPYDVLLGRLGDDRLRQLKRDWQSEPRESGPKRDCLWFESTGHNVCDQVLGTGFKQYWESNGLADPALDPYHQSLTLFGLPLTSAKMETNTSGDTVLTQWFERARFEWHPNNPEQFKVLLGLLGNEVLPTPFVPDTPTASCVCKAEEEGVTVVVPDQGKQIKVENLPKEVDLLEQPGFKPIRSVINFEVIDAQSGEILERFEPPIKLEVAYTVDDLEAVGGDASKLKLGIFDEKQKIWIVFGVGHQKFTLDEAEMRGILELSGWGDRGVAWAR